jgi:hypothetical protein
MMTDEGKGSSYHLPEGDGLVGYVLRKQPVM